MFIYVLLQTVEPGILCLFLVASFHLACFFLYRFTWQYDLHGCWAAHLAADAQHYKLLRAS